MLKKLEEAGAAAVPAPALAAAPAAAGKLSRVDVDVGPRLDLGGGCAVAGCWEEENPPPAVRVLPVPLLLLAPEAAMPCT